MADILIKGMELPKDGHYYLEVFTDGEIRRCDNVAEGFVNTDSEAIALPEHGRLGDLDEMISDCDKMAEYCKKNGNMNGYDKWQRFSAYIDEAPVIVEATE